MKELESLFDIPITFSGEKGEKGERGLRGFRGDDGESIKGDKGERGNDGKNGVNGKSGLDGANGKDGLNGKSGIAGKSIKGDKGEDGLSAYEIWLHDNNGTEEEFLKSLKGKDAKQTQWHGNAYTELKEQEDTNISDPQDGDILVFDGTKWVNGSPLVEPVEIDDDYLNLDTDGTIKAVANKDITVTLRTAEGIAGTKQRVKHMGTNDLTVKGVNSELIDLADCIIINEGVTGAYTSLTFESDGEGWLIV